MKGLFLNDWYKSKQNMALLLCITFLLSIVIIGLCEQQLIIQAYIVYILLSIPICSLVCSYSFDSINWNKYAITLPLKKERIIQEKYLFSIASFFIGILTSTIFLLLIIKARGFLFFDLGFKDIATLYCLSTTLVFFVYTFYFFMRYAFNSTDSGLNIIISIIIATCLSGGIIYFLNRFSVSLETGRIIMVLCAFFSFFVSYKINQVFYCKKDIE